MDRDKIIDRVCSLIISRAGSDDFRDTELDIVFFTMSQDFKIDFNNVFHGLFDFNGIYPYPLEDDDEYSHYQGFAIDCHDKVIYVSWNYTYEEDDVFSRLNLSICVTSY